MKWLSWRLLKNRYVIIFMLYAVWITFFDQNSLLDQFRLMGEIRDLEQNKNFYKNEINALRKEHTELFGSLKNLEKFGREKFYMTREGETLIVIERAEKD